MSGRYFRRPIHVSAAAAPTVMLVPMQRSRVRVFLPVIAGAAVFGAFIALNHAAFRGYFQDDELDTLKWAPSRPLSLFLLRLADPRFDPGNFRPVGHLFFHLMGRGFGLNFPPYIVPVFGFHLINALLLYLILRKLEIGQWCAIAAVAFFCLSASAFEAYWKPMYVFDLLCTALCLASVLFFANRRWIPSFVAFWLAYKAKEPAVMLPAVLAVWEYWFGMRRLKVLVPFFLVALSFGLHGLIRNPNKDNEYTLRFTFDALRHTLPYYSNRLLLFPSGGLLLCALVLVRDRRVWFGLAGALLMMTPVMFLPGRLFQAYAYLPLAFATVAIAAAASHVNPAWAWAALALWTPFNLRDLRHERRATLDADTTTASFIFSMKTFAGRYPSVRTFVYDGTPPGFHDWGVVGGWNILHEGYDWPALYSGSPEGKAALAAEPVAYGSWSQQTRSLTIILRKPQRQN